MSLPTLRIDREFKPEGTYIRLCDETNDYLLDEWLIVSFMDQENFHNDLIILGFNPPRLREPPKLRNNRC